MALVTTPGASNANSYLGYTEADAYFALRPYSTKWTAANTATKEQVLAYATSLLDQSFSWGGYIASQTQALRWPRVGLLDLDQRLVDSLTIPARVKNACCELALAFLARDRTKESPLAGKGIDSAKLGEMAITVSKPGENTTPPLIPDLVVTLLSGFGVPTGAASGGGFTIGKVERT